jgi:hypothetical protein
MAIVYCFNWTVIPITWKNHRCGVAFLLYWYFERPMTALRDKWHIPNMTVVKAFIFSGRRIKINAEETIIGKKFDDK